MSKVRMVNTRFWDDNYTSNLDPIEKLLFLYFLTNTSTNICGIYEIPLKKIATDTGIDKEMVLRIMERFSKEGKIFYYEGWVCIKNFTKHQSTNIHIQKGIELGLNAIPKDVLEEMMGHGYPIDGALHLNLNSNLNSNSNKKGYDPLGSEIIKRFEEIDPKNKKHYGNKTQRESCDFLIKEYGLEKTFRIIDLIKSKRGTPFFPSITSPYELQQKWTKIGEAIIRENKTTNNHPNL